MLSRGLHRYSPPLQAAKSLQITKSGRSIAPTRTKPRSLPLRADKVSKVGWQPESKLTFGRLVLPVAIGMKPAATSSSSCRGEPAKQSLAAPDRGDLTIAPVRLVVISPLVGLSCRFPRCAILLPTVWDGLSAWGWSNESFAILRIFAHFQMAGLPMPALGADQRELSHDRQ